MYRICLTGHRPKDVVSFMPNGSDIYDMHNIYWRRVMGKLVAIILSNLQQHPEGLECHSGLALGADTAWAYAILIAQKRVANPNLIKFVADCPLPTQACRWAKTSQSIWQKLINIADQVNYTSTGEYTPSVMEKRNQQMIIPSDLCIAFWSGKKFGGTYNGVRDAINHHVPILRLDPRDFA